MKKIKIISSLLLGILIFSTKNVYAENIEVNKNSSIQYTYVYGNEYFENVNISLYQLASIDIQGNYIFTENFNDLDNSIKKISTSELNALAVTINKKIETKKIQVLNNQPTDSKGIASFNNITPGLYLINTDSVTNKDYKYKTSPIIVSIPLYDQINNQYKYDLSIVSKTEAKYIGEQTNDGNTTNPPNTIDSIMIYSAVFIISLICIIGLVCYINKLKKEGCIKNDKKNN